METVVCLDVVHDLALVVLSREVERGHGIGQLVGRLARGLGKRGGIGEGTEQNGTKPAE